MLLVLALAPTDIGTGTGWTPGYFTEPSDGADSIGGWGAAPPAGIDPLCSIPRERWCVGDEEVYAKKNADGTRGGNVSGTSLYHTHSRKRTRAHVYDTASHQSPSIFLSIYTYVYFLCHHYHSGAISAAMFGQDPVQAHLRRRSEACSDIGTDGPMESKTALA